ncbi:MAG: YgdI/YgdR family lipoprotein [Desulfobulbaceae bacterium]|nr:YgdI/YgdR family lipoprotein [Desulfobulbaceae bacterium]
MMKKIMILMAILFCIFGLAACSTPHVMMLKDGRVIELADEPDFDSDTGFYEYETAKGKKVRINKNEVVEIKER